MLFIYGLAAVVSLAVAWMIKLIFTAIQMQKARAEARSDARAKAVLEPGTAAADKSD